MQSYSRSVFADRARRLNGWDARQHDRALWATRKLENWARTEPAELQYLSDGMVSTAIQRREAEQAAKDYLWSEFRQEYGFISGAILWLIAWTVIKVIIMLWLNEMVNNPGSYERVMNG